MHEAAAILLAAVRVLEYVLYLQQNEEQVVYVEIRERRQWYKASRFVTGYDRCEWWGRNYEMYGNADKCPDLSAFPYISL